MSIARSITVCILFVLCASMRSNAQQTFCPYNLDFEQGNLSGWRFDTGSCCPINIPGGTAGALFGRHTLMSGPGLDSFGKFPIVAPGGGQHSLRLGNYAPGSDADRALYYIQVPPGPNKYIFIYRYAVVLEDPSHPVGAQPRFQVRTFDSVTGITIPCNSHTYVSDANLPGFKLSPFSGNWPVYYKEWTSASLDLSAYNGKTVGVEFSSGDCGQGGHFGYGYVDMNCGLFQIWATNCNNSNDVILKGPPGYQFYKWMDANFLQTYGNTQDITIPTPTTAGYFAVIVTPYPGFGCADTFYTEYNVKKDNITAIAPDVKYCENQVAKLSVSTTNPNGPFLYNWWPAGDLSCTTCSNPTANPGGNATYYVSIENVHGCRDTADVAVTMVQKPQANAGPDTTVCPGTAVMLDAHGGVSYQWFPSYGLDDPKSPTPIIRVDTQRVFKLSVKNSDGCHDTDDVKVTVYPRPFANAGQDSTVCFGAIVQLRGKSNNPADKYKWLPKDGLTNANIADPLALLGKSIDYYLTVENEYGCKSTDTVSFYTFFPEPLNAGPDTSICHTDTIQLYARGGQVVTWFSDHAISDKDVADPLVWPGYNYIYEVSISDTLCNRADTLDVVIRVHPQQQLRVVATPIICGGEAIGQLTAYGGKGYQWIPADYLSDPYGAITKANPKTSTLYTLTGINAYGCQDTATALLEVHGDDGVFAPNAFTPNGDGKNDCYRFIVTGDVRTFEWRIFNRWGQPVFESRSYNDCWDGTFRGEPLDLGTYYYFFKATTPLCGEIIRKGDIQLIR